MAKMSAYWFPAKRYGWGWGVPTVWQGWVVLIVWGFAFAVGLHRFAPQHGLAFGIFLMTWTASLIVVCYAKGEPPAWRWGDRK